MLDASQGMEGVQQDLVAGFAGPAGDEANPARIVLVPGCSRHRVSFGRMEILP
jgi:hypothetical protein